MCVCVCATNKPAPQQAFLDCVQIHVSTAKIKETTKLLTQVYMYKLGIDQLANPLSISTSVPRSRVEKSNETPVVSG